MEPSAPQVLPGPQRPATNSQRGGAKRAATLSPALHQFPAGRRQQSLTAASPYPWDCAGKGTLALHEHLALVGSQLRGLSPMVPFVAKASGGRLPQSQWSRRPWELPAEIGPLPVHPRIAPAGPEICTALLAGRAQGGRCCLCEPEGSHGSSLRTGPCPRCLRQSLLVVTGGGFWAGQEEGSSSSSSSSPGAAGNLSQGELQGGGRTRCQAVSYGKRLQGEVPDSPGRAGFLGTIVGVQVVNHRLHEVRSGGVTAQVPCPNLKIQHREGEKQGRNVIVNRVK